MTDLHGWHKSVLERDGYKCMACGQDFSAEYYFQEDNNGRVNQMLTGHHIQTQKAHPELIFDVSNGISVCKECHTKIHKGLIDADSLVTETEKINEEEKVERIESVHPVDQRFRLRGGEELCACGKFIAIKATGICMACEKGSPMFKKEKKKSKK